MPIRTLSDLKISAIRKLVSSDGDIEVKSITVNGAVNYGNVISDPTGDIPIGSECYNTTEKRKKFYDGTKWVDPMKYV